VAFIHPSSGSETCLACGASTFFVKWWICNTELKIKWQTFHDGSYYSCFIQSFEKKQLNLDDANYILWILKWVLGNLNENLIIALNFVFRGKHSIHSHDKVLRDCRQNVKTNIYVLVSSEVNFKPVENIFFIDFDQEKKSKIYV
jgi:hypothetical protein